MKLLNQIQYKKLLLLAFWFVVLMINLGYDWLRFESLREMVEVAGAKTTSQWLVAFVAVKWLVPKLLKHDKRLIFGLTMLILAWIVALLFITLSYLYLEPTYPTSYGAYYIKNLGDYSLIERLGFSDMIRYILISKIPTLLFPAVILIAANFYETQQRLLKFKEHKQAAELNALKTQLNPHFIFNTLNNIYSMAVNNSIHTAEAIAKLSGIFDYILYQCNDKFVALTAEVEMIENYLALESLRYGERINVRLKNNINEPVYVAPLLYLTLVENAFKHGVAQELTQAKIKITLTSDSDDVVFCIKNSKPPFVKTDEKHESIGLKNLQRQLALIYPNQHKLIIKDTPEMFQVTLKLSAHTCSKKNGK